MSYIKSSKRGSKVTKEEVDNALQEIRNDLKFHLGQYAILYIKKSRDMVPYFVELVGSCNLIAGRIKCYTPENEFRCYQTQYINPIDILTGTQKIVFFDDGI